jgi:hypothetical protein
VVSVGPPSINGTGQLEVQEVTETSDSVDGMGALVFANEEESGFFGEHRSVSFMTKTRDAVLLTGMDRSFFQYCVPTPRVSGRNPCD